MKTIIAGVVSLCLLAGGAFTAYQLNDRWNDPVVLAESKLSVPGDASIKANETKDLKETIRESQKRVVSIQVTYPEGTAIGSGFLYNDLGDVVTNAHVVNGGVNIKVKSSDTSIHPGKVIGMNEEKDVAVVRVEALAGKEPLAYDKDTKAEVGDEVMAFGSPLGLENTVTTGIISGVDRDFDLEETKYRGVYQISAPITHGNSGGPLIMKSTGKVIGINSAGEEIGTIGYAIPYHQVADMIENWSAHPDKKLADSSSSDEAGSAEGYTKELMEDNAKYLITYFYESLNGLDYVTAYSLLGSDWQSKTTYDKFREGYLNTISVAVTSVSVNSSSSESAEVTALIEAWENKDGVRVLSNYKSTYIIRPENGTLKIISGKGKKL
ncbi:S1C family serine protease [Cohnella mopanensis]|uniref:S1C family serine protease n=1 Tax=Cohnella mopanensis TaxID=2911966 RepID=UPI001EF96A45|nr:trypsin-like peptidase domain-containing protein [Cohnella mopanensis]